MSTASTADRRNQQYIWTRAILHHLDTLSLNSEKQGFIHFCNSIPNRPIQFNNLSASRFRSIESSTLDQSIIIDKSQQLSSLFKIRNNTIIDSDKLTKADLLDMIRELASSSAKSVASPASRPPIIKIAEPSRFSGQRDIAFIDS